MNETPLVSVVINCHNSETYLRDAIDSVFNQTYQNWELIFWDNNSSDSSAEIAKSYGEKVHYFHNQITLTLGEARQRATEVCKGKYLAFLDCDDFWYPDKLFEQVRLISANNGIGFVYGKADILLQDINTKKEFGRRKFLPEGDIFSELIKEDFIPFPSVLIDIEKFREIGGFPIHFINSPDYWIFLHLAEIYEVRALQTPCCVYRIHSQNLSKKQIVESALESIELVKKFLPNPEAKIGLKHHNVTLSFSYLRARKYIDFMKIFTKISWKIFIIRVGTKIIRQVLSWR